MTASDTIVAFGAGEAMFNSGGQLSSKHRREVDLYVYTEEIDELHDRIKDRVELVEDPHNMFYGMSALIFQQAGTTMQFLRVASSP